MTPAILFVDDEPHILDGLRDGLRHRRREFDMAFANGGAEALELLAAQPYDVVVSDMRMPGLDGAQLLAHVREQYPGSVRIILSGQTSEEAALRMVPVAHLAMAKPCTGGDLSRMLDRACAVGALLTDPALRATVHHIGALPSPPEVGRRLVAAVEDHDASAASLAAIAQEDVALTAKVLQLVNSGFFGLPQSITDLQRGISLLGIDLLRTLALSDGALREFRPAPVLKGFDLGEFERHSRTVADIAAALAAPGADSRTAASAGLLHDVGVLVLASRVPERFSEALALAASEHVALHEAETAVLGVTHCAVGAYLLALWGLPAEVVDAVGTHALPPEPTTVASPLAIAQAVRVAVLVADDGGHRQSDHLGALTVRDVLEAQAPPDVVDAWLAHARQESPT